MPKRVYELAKELGYDKQMLVTKINALDIGIKGCNPFTALSDDEVAKVKSALKTSKAQATAEVVAEDKDVAATAGEQETALPVRRRSSKKKSSAEEDDNEQSSSAAEASVGPRIIRRTRKTVSVADDNQPEVAVEVMEQPAPEPEEAPAVVAQAAETKPAVEAAEPQQTETAQQGEATAQAAATPQEDAQPQPEAANATPAPEADAPATPEAKTPEADKADKPAPRRVQRVSSGEPRQEAPADGANGQPAQRPATPAPAATAAGAPGAAPAAPRKAGGPPGGAKILGRIDLGTMQDRMDTERFVGTPPTPERRPRTTAPGTAGARPARDTAAAPAAGASTEERGTASERRKRRGERGGEDDRDRGRGRQVRDRDSIYEGRGRRGRGGRQQKLKTKKPELTLAAEHKRVVRIEDTTTVGELGREMGVKAGLLALKLMELGITGNVNTTIDYDTATLLAEQFGYTVENVAFDISRFYDTSEDAEETLRPRPPIVTVMGHVDHGKTSLLDAIRSTAVTTGEAGGITQHIGAYTVTNEDGGKLTFLDTPGHEAFTALRARGAQATDIVVLVVAADDGVMPQTVEAINHARAAEVPIIVAVNKIDKNSANSDRVKQALSEYSLQPEEWGGSTQFVEVSALKRINIDKLMEALLLQAEISELTARPDRDAQGIVIESRLDKGRGPLASILVQRGTLRVGDIVVIGEQYGRVRNMVDHRGTDMTAAGPSQPVEITGLSGVPEAGEPFFVVTDEKDAKRITEHVGEMNRQKHMAKLAKSGMDKLTAMLANREGGERKKLKVIIKGDVQGSIEALRQSFSKQGNDEVSVDVIHAAVGSVTENDVNLAASTADGAVVIIGFAVRPDPRAMEVAEKYGIEIMTFNIIYDAIDSIRALLEGLLSPVERENVLGHAEVRETFQAPKVGTIAGLYVTDGMLRRNAKARLLRNGKVIYSSTLATLRRFKDDVREVQKGFECGASLHNYNDIKIGDIIEAYEVEEVAATLD